MTAKKRERNTRTEIDHDDLVQARRDPAMHDLLADAAAEGDRVEREGRQMW